MAVADGEVIDSGPASGFGMWVRLKHADGTITVYGHINTSTVTVGQKVMAGDQIATVGNRGFSTGPHLHFEVHLARREQDRSPPLAGLPRHQPRPRDGLTETLRLHPNTRLRRMHCMRRSRFAVATA